MENGLRVLIAACDTFRSGAVEQLRTHTHHLNALHPAEGGLPSVSLYAKGYDKDAAGVATDAIHYGKRERGGEGRRGERRGRRGKERGKERGERGRREGRRGGREGRGRREERRRGEREGEGGEREEEGGGGGGGEEGRGEGVREGGKEGDEWSGKLLML